jgi:vacuolar-type H+-ATPase subunit H
MPDRDQVINQLKQQLDVLNAKLDDLEAKAAQASGEAKAEYEKRMQDLKEMAQPARDKLKELRAAGEDQWDRLANEAEKHYKALVHSFNYFKSQVR